MDLSIIIVSFNSRNVLPACLDSLVEGLSVLNETGRTAEIHIVDNHSVDGTQQFLADFRETRRETAVNVILNQDNRGYARANNQALREANGKYVLLLNPDTTLQRSTLHLTLESMERQSEVGIAGVRLLKPDGSLDPACRRSFPTPGVSLFFFLNKIFRLGRVFPENRRFHQYNLTFLDPTGQYEVDSVVGAFMMIRREVIERIGFLDERFFMYGEDLDYCLRAHEAGFQIFYFGQIVAGHHKSTAARSTQNKRFRSRRTLRAFYYSMFLFYNKHYMGTYFPLTTVLVYFGILSAFLAEFIHSFFVARN